MVRGQLEAYTNDMVATLKEGVGVKAMPNVN